MREKELMTPTELYPSLVQMIIHTENITWSRFSNFLMFSAILVVPWATIWTTTANSSQSKTVVLVAICILGILSGVFWAALGYRGRAFLYDYINMAEEFEADSAVWAAIVDKYKLGTNTKTMRDSLRFSWAGSRTLLIGGPLIVTALYVAMLVVSLR